MRTMIAVELTEAEVRALCEQIWEGSSADEEALRTAYNKLVNALDD